jgi:hypothetical protein
MEISLAVWHIKPTRILLSWLVRKSHQFTKKEDCWAMLPNIPWTYRIALLKSLIGKKNTGTFTGSYWIAIPNLVWYYRIKLGIKCIVWIYVEYRKLG